MYLSLNISTSKRDVGGACSIIEMGNVFTITREYLREGDHLGDPEADVRIIFKCIFGKSVMIWAGLISYSSGCGPMAVSVNIETKLLK